MDRLREELIELFTKFNINNEADSLALLNFALELESRYTISVLELEVERITDIDYLYEAISSE